MSSSINAGQLPPTPDFRLLFESLPGAYIVLTPDLIIAAASDAYTHATLTERSALLGKPLFDAFPENADDPMTTGMRQIRASLERVLRNQVPDTLALQRYDIRRPAHAGGGYEEHYWSLVSSPVFGPNHELLYIIHRIDDVTGYVRFRQLNPEPNTQHAPLDTLPARLESEIYGRIQESQARLTAEVQREQLYRLFMQAPAAVAVLRGPNHVFELANPRYHQLIGEHRPLIGKTLREALPESAPAVHMRIHRVYAAGERFVGEEFPVVLDWEYNGQPYIKFLNIVYEPLRDADGHVDSILIFAYDVTDQVVARQRLALLAETSAVLTALLDYEAMLRSVAGLAVPILADFCFFDVLRPDGMLERVAWAHTDSAMQALFDQVCRYTPPYTASPDHPITNVIATGTAEFVPHVTEEWLQGAAVSAEHLHFLHELHFHAAMIIPVIARERTIGALTLGLVDPHRRYTNADRELAEELGRRVALAVESARLYAAAQRARTEAERRLAQLTAVIDSIPDAVYIGTATGITMCNQVALTSLGFTNLEDLSHNVEFLADQIQTRDANTGRRIAVEDEVFSRALRGQASASDVIVRHIQSGEDRILRSAAAPIQYNGQILGAVAVNTDITDRKQAEIERAQLLEREQAARAEAEAAVRVRDDFLSVAAHELKTPVTSLRGYVQLLLRQIATGRTLDPERSQRALNAINQQSFKLTRFIDQLLDVSRIASGSLVLERQPTNVGQLVTEVVAGIQSTTPQHTLHMSVNGDTRATIDPLRIEQVITNLVTNAVKYSPTGGTVEVNVDRFDATMLQISVTDHGIGIPPEHRAHIFERFYQAHGSGYFGGMGLGLSISQAITALHRGQLRAEFPDPGGTRMVLTLPVDG